MSAYLFTWNPKRWHWSDFQVAISHVNNEIPYDTYWSCGNTKRIAVGDIFFLMRVGQDPKGIIGCGYISSKPYELPHWDKDKAAEGKIALRTGLLLKALSEEPIVSLDKLKEYFSDYNWTPQASGLSIPNNIATELFSLIQDQEDFNFRPLEREEVSTFAEGKVREITLTTYDRSPPARRACIEKYGYECSICGFNFEEVYGDIGKEYIEVHHLKPIADIGKEYKIDPIKDLRPVCANCHRMLHKKKRALSVKELKELLNR